MCLIDLSYLYICKHISDLKIPVCLEAQDICLTVLHVYMYVCMYVLCVSRYACLQAQDIYLTVLRIYMYVCIVCLEAQDIYLTVLRIYIYVCIYVLCASRYACAWKHRTFTLQYRGIQDIYLRVLGDIDKYPPIL